jgi:hypothetical protein
MRISSRSLWYWLPCLLLIPVGMLPLLHIGSMTWLESVRITCIAAGLGYLLRPGSRLTNRWSAAAGALLSLGYISVALQFSSSGPPAPGQWSLSIAALLTATLVALQYRPFSVSVVDWVPIVPAGVLVVVMAVAYQVRGADDSNTGFPWLPIARIASCLFLWFAVTRISEHSVPMRRSLTAVLVGVLGVAALAGLLTMASIPYYWLNSQRARAKGDTVAAIDFATRGATVSGDLTLESQEKAFRFRVASIWSSQGEMVRASETLGLQVGFVDVIHADSWEGPEGGNLFYDISCWKDIEFLPGQVQLQVYARGNAVDGEWSQMRVGLDGQHLGDVWVTSTESRPYSFDVTVPEHRVMRLQVSFLNDLHDPSTSRDRNLTVDDVELHYWEITWDQE